MAEAEANEHLADDTKGDDEDLMSKHRQERRELQAKIQQLKKSINKNDKNRKKKVDAEIHELEEAFAKRWANFDEAKVKTTDNNQSEVNQNADVPQTSAVVSSTKNIKRSEMDSINDNILLISFRQIKNKMSLGKRDV